MKRKIVLLHLVAVLLATTPPVEAQQPKKVPRVCSLENTAAISAIDMEPYRKRLRDLGYIERQNIAFEPRYYEGKIERLSDLAAELTGENGVRVILVDLSFSEL